MSAALVLGVGACGTPADDRAPDYSSNLALRSASDAPALEWSTDLGDAMDSLTFPVEMRANAGIVTVLRRFPDRLTTFGLALHGMRLAERPMHVDPIVQGVLPRSVARGAGVVHLDSAGSIWLLDGDSSRVIAEGIGGFEGTVGRLAFDSLPQRTRGGCRLDPARLLLIDADSTADLLSIDLGNFSTTARTPVQVVDSALAHHRGRLRVSGSRVGPCVLWSRAAPVLAIWQRGRWLIAPRIWDQRLADSSTTPTFTTDVVDVTSHAGGVIMLVGPAGRDEGHLLDVYDASGRYLETLRLPTPATRIASAEGRLILLSNPSGRWVMSSLPLPRRIRQGPLDDIPAIHTTRPAPKTSAPGV